MLTRTRVNRLGIILCHEEASRGGSVVVVAMDMATGASSVLQKAYQEQVRDEHGASHDSVGYTIG